MRNERRTSGSGMGAAETSADNRAIAPPPHFHPNGLFSEAHASTSSALAPPIGPQLGSRRVGEVPLARGAPRVGEGRSPRS